MKLNQIFEAISFRDPDHEPGAIDREARARSSLADRQQESAENLNTIAARFHFKSKFYVGKYSPHDTWQQVKADASPVTFNGKSGQIGLTFGVTATDGNLVVLSITGIDTSTFPTQAIEQLVSKGYSGIFRKRVSLEPRFNTAYVYLIHAHSVTGDQVDTLANTISGILKLLS